MAQNENQLQALQKRSNDYNLRETTRVFELLSEQLDPTTFKKERYKWLQKLILQLAIKKRSVTIVNQFLTQILVKEDAKHAFDLGESLYFDCVQIKFITVQMLARVCKVTTQELLKHASAKIYSNITWFMLKHKCVPFIIEEVCNCLAFYKDHILHRSWFHLIYQHEGTAAIKKDDFDKLLTYQDIKTSKKIFSRSEIQKNLHYLLAKIATSKSGNSNNYACKKNLFNAVKNVFGFEKDQDLMKVFNEQHSYSKNSKEWFESLVLTNLVEKMGLSRNYFMELILNKDPDDFMNYYDIDLYWQSNILTNDKNEQVLKKQEKVSEALEFLLKQIKKDASIQQSDFCICFLQTFSYIFPKRLDADKYSAAERQNLIYGFINLVILLLKKDIYKGLDCLALLEEALIQKTLFVLQHASTNENTVAIAVQALQLLLNEIGTEKTLKFFPQIFCLLVMAFMQHQEKSKLQNHVAKIFKYYLKEKQKHTVAEWNKIQFIMLLQSDQYNHSKKINDIRELINTVAADLYANEDKIEQSFKVLLQQIKSSNQEIKRLSVQYIFNILEEKKTDSIRKQLIRPEMLKQVQQTILEIKHEKSDTDLGVICAKVIAFIGLCHSFTHDPIQLKATNQQTLLEQDQVERIQAAQSERINPLTNMSYNQQQHQDNTLEKIAFPDLEKLPLEKEHPIKFATALKNLIHEISITSNESPTNLFFTQFLLLRFIKSCEVESQTKQRGDLIVHNPHEVLNSGEQIQQKETQRLDQLMKSIKKFTCITEVQEQNKHIKHYTEFSLSKFAIFLSQKIENDNWRQVVEAVVPLLSRKYSDILRILLQYFVYITIRQQVADEFTLADSIAGYINEILTHAKEYDVDLTLKMLEFFKIAIQEDKQRFKKFLESETRYKYNEKLFHLETNPQNDKDNNQDLQNFREHLNRNLEIKKSFLSVKKFERILGKIDKSIRNQAAKKTYNLKRNLYNLEDTYRKFAQNQVVMEEMPNEDVVELIKINKQLQPEDFNDKYFNSIIEDNKHNNYFEQIPYQLMDNSDESLVQEEQMRKLLKNPKAAVHLRECQFQHLVEWMGNFDIAAVFKFNNAIFIIPLQQEDKRQYFESILALLFAEYYKTNQFLLRSNEFAETDPNFQQYQNSLVKLKRFINRLQSELIYTLDCMQGETKVLFKLFLHVLYEIETAIYYIKDLFLSESEKIQEQLRREVNKDKRKFERLYHELNLNDQFEKLLTWFHRRSQMTEIQNDQMHLIYMVRLAIFSIFDREHEQCFYLMKLAKLFRLMDKNQLEISNYFKKCNNRSDKIVDFELEYTKYLWEIRNANEAHQYIIQKLDIIKDKVDRMRKQIGFSLMPKLVFQKAQLLEIQLLIEIDPKNDKIFPRFTEYVKQIEKDEWEKPNFLFAQFIDMLESKIPKQEESKQSEEFKAERKKRRIQRIYYYIRSIQYGHKFIWQSLPRALELWFGYQEQDAKVTNFMSQELIKLDSYKIATVLQILLSRFGHQRQEVRDCIVKVLAKLAVAYPHHSAWWIFHFHFFDESSNTAAARQRGQHGGVQPAISRQQFAQLVLKACIMESKNATEQIMKCETLFGDLRKLAEKEVKAQENTMDMPKQLSSVNYVTNLVMPTEENLTPQLPRGKQFNRQLEALCNTSLSVLVPNKKNLDANIDFCQDNQDDSKSFPAYKPNPVRIQGFQQKIQIMSSKEKPKKIGILGTDGKMYNFLLKFDKQGDLRKEQRFIEFAMLCNKMLLSDKQARLRGLHLRTYSITPLSKCTGLIEWIQNTSTLKVLVTDQWKRNSIKGDMTEIKKMAQAAQKGDTHTLIWNEVKKATKPVLANWFSEHYPSPDLWYEARVNFAKTCAIWSMIGYAIGLGDRHGDNILIHQHTGQITHVDFDCIFEKGAQLKVPEIVPFRLTQNLIDAFGILKEKGVFQKTCEVTLRVLRNNHKNIISYLESFNHDPLIEHQHNIKISMDTALDLVDKKLTGNVNIKNAAALTIEEQVMQVILNAINDDSLSKMYIGWMPWL